VYCFFPPLDEAALDVLVVLEALAGLELVDAELLELELPHAPIAMAATQQPRITASPRDKDFMSHLSLTLDGGGTVASLPPKISNVKLA
jgi:hypothetical protein